MLLPKIKDLSIEKYYRPITCLNASYKIFTGALESFMKEHVIRNDILNMNQIEKCEGVVETVDQLLIEHCILSEIRNHKRFPREGCTGERAANV